MANFGPIAAEIGSRVWGTPANFNGFRILPSLLQRRLSPEVNQTSHDVWPSPGLVYYIHLRGSCPLPEFCQVQNSLCVQVLRSPILTAFSTRHSSRGRQPNFVAYGTRNGITELSQTAPPIFGWAAVTLGIGPHSSFALFHRIRYSVRRSGHTA